MQHSPTLTINDKTYSLVSTREYTPVSIYTNTESFLRIGPKELILPELNFHKDLLAYGFPVSTILEEGEHEDHTYYIESSLGSEHLGIIFGNDMQRTGAISPDHFEAMVAMAKQYTQGQINSGKPSANFESFYYGVHVHYIIKELPHLKAKILQAFEKICARVSILPTVLTQGDFNPFNMFEKGVIDFGNSYEAPLGYDLVSAIYSTFMFPLVGDFETKRLYTYTAEQIQHYFSEIESIFTKNELPPLSTFIPDFILCRTMWSAVRMDHYPKVQAWRYAKFEKILNAYLEDGDIIKLLIQI